MLDMPLERVRNGSLGARAIGLLSRLARSALLVIAAAGSVPAISAISYVAASTDASSGSTNTVTVTRPAGTAANDVMLAYITQRGNGFPLHQNMVSVPAGWTFVLSQDDGSSVGLVIYRKVASAAEPSDYSWVLGASDRTAGAVIVFRGVDTVSPVHVGGAQANAASTTYTAPSLTTTVANTMLVAFYSAVNGSGSVNAATGMTQAFSAGTGAGRRGVVIGSSYVAQAVAGATGTRVTTGNASQVNLGAMVALNAAPPMLLANWRMDESSWSGSTNEVQDSSGNAYHGTARIANGATPVATAVSGTPAYTNGGQSTCNFGQFDSTSGTTRTYTYVELPGVPALSGSFTVAAWVRSTNTGASGQRIMVRDDADNGWGFSLGDGGAGSVRLFNRRISNSGAVSGNGRNPGCGVFCLDTNSAVSNNAWSYVAASINTSTKVVSLYVFDASGTLVVATSSSFSGTWQDGSGMLAIGGETAASGEGRQTGFHFRGNVDEVKLFDGALTQAQAQAQLSDTRVCPGAAPDHYELSLPTSSISCLPTTVTVTACANSSSPCNSPYSAASGTTATLSASGGALGSMGVVFGSGGVASTTLSYPLSPDGTPVSVTLSGEQTTATNPRKCCANGSSCTAANSCSTTFNSAGFVVAAAASGAAATIAPQIAGTASGTFYLRAVRSSTSTAACSAALVGANTVDMAYVCNNPSNCSASNLMSVDGGSATTIQRNNSPSASSFTPVPMTFDAAGSAPFSFTFGDVGQSTLWFSKTVNAAPLAGMSNAFVTRPAGFTVAAIMQSAVPNLANPGALSASGPKFVKAGESFGVAVSARTSVGAIAPNYGRESSPEGVLLTPSLVLPVGGNAGALANAVVAGASMSSGVATVSNLAWSEVGILNLTPSVADGDYLGAGNVSGSASGNIGRFVPDRFALSAATITPRASLTCSPASTFTYLGESFRFGFTLTALNTSGATTQNYSGLFAKLDPANASAWQLAGISGVTPFSTANGRLTLGSASGSWIAGVASTVSLSAATTRMASPEGPFASSFGIAPVDSDGVTLAAYDLDTDSPVNGNDRSLLGVMALRYGRLRMANAYGSELLPLNVPLEAQYWAGQYYVGNAADSCTVMPMASITMGNYQKQLNPCETQISPTGNVMMAAGRMPGAGLVLSRPGLGDSGSVDLSINLGAVPVGNTCQGASETAATAASLLWFGPNPGARATFGVFKSPLIYKRENY